MSTRILVVGGAGYIGSHCVRDLRDQGAEVVVFDDLSMDRNPVFGKNAIYPNTRDYPTVGNSLGDLNFKFRIQVIYR